MEQQCQATRAGFSQYLDDEIGPKQKAGIELHLQQCSACREEFSKVQNTVMAVRNLPRIKAPAGMADGVLRELDHGSHTPVKERKIVRLRPRIMAVAASLLLASALTLMLGRRHILDVQPYPELTEVAKTDVEAPEPAPEVDPALPEAMRSTSLERFEDTGEAARGIAAMQREDLRERRVGHAFERQKGQDLRQKDIHMDEKLSLGTIEELDAMVRSLGAKNIKLAIDSEEELRAFELDFELDAARYARLQSALQEGLAPLPADRIQSRAFRMFDLEEQVDEPEANETPLPGRFDLAEEPAEERLPEDAEAAEEEPPDMIRIQLRVTGGEYAER